MKKIKICGLSREADIEAVNEFQPEYIGFVFAEKSKRKVTFAQAKLLKAELDKNIKAVGVFVNQDMDFLISLAENNIIDAIQLHGDEDETYCKKLSQKVNVPIIKAVRVRNKDDILKYSEFPCSYLLLDTYTKDNYGGSGKTFDWSMIPKLSKRFFLAGGLNIQNISDAVKTQAYCLDVSSGVETDGVKDKTKIENIIKKVRSE